MITINDLKERWFNAYPEIMGISGDKPIQCYAKKDVDECLAGRLNPAKNKKIHVVFGVDFLGGKEKKIQPI